MNAIKRGLRGALLGAAVATAIAVILSILLFGLVAFVFESPYPLHRADELHNLMLFLPLAVSAGIIVGAIGGFAARMPPRGVSILTSIAIVAVCAIVGGFLRVAQPRFKGSPEPLFLLPILGALIGGVLVMWYGIATSRREAMNQSVGRFDTTDVDAPSESGPSTRQ
ncbi:MAG: hypothetical protein GX621_04625 [Pirellulaceae bacterium]|nr:hypothetical protein [Pirellulaceae bacterium]